MDADGIGAVFWPVGAYVTVTLVERADVLLGCHDKFELKNLDVWDGDPNPGERGDLTWFVGSRRGRGAGRRGLLDRARPARLLPHADRLRPARRRRVPREALGAASTDVAMGQVAEIGSPTWIFRNLQSFTSGLCDDPPHAAYYVFTPILD